MKKIKPYLPIVLVSIVCLSPTGHLILDFLNDSQVNYNQIMVSVVLIIVMILFIIWYLDLLKVTDDWRL